MKNQFTESGIQYEEILGIKSTMTLQDLIIENEKLASGDREKFRALVGI